MTPAEHRETAVDLLSFASSLGGDLNSRALFVAEAQVHATLALAPVTTPPPPKPKPAQRVEVLDVQLRPLMVGETPDGNLWLAQHSAEWSTVLDNPGEVRLLADTLTAHADRMETNR